MIAPLPASHPPPRSTNRMSHADPTGIVNHHAAHGPLGATYETAP